MPDDDRGRITAYLVGLGATEDEIADAFRTGDIGTFALDLAFRGDGEVLAFEAAAERSGLDVDIAARYWRALGFPDPSSEPPRLSSDALDMFGLVAAGRDLVGDDATLALTRVLGAATSRVAQAMVDVVRIQVETPLHVAGVAYADVMERYVGLARDMLPGFVDAMGYTALARTMSPHELVGMIDRFEHVVTEAAARHRGRVVKLIGDAAMFSVDDATAGCRIALDIVEAAASTDLAARLVAVAPEHAVVVSEEVRSRVGESMSFELLPPQSLKGFGAPSVAYLLASAP